MQGAGLIYVLKSWWFASFIVGFLTYLISFLMSSIQSILLFLKIH